MNRILYLSCANVGSESGVYFYLKKYINIQKKAGIAFHWFTIKKIT